MTTHFLSRGADGLDTSVHPALLPTSYAALGSLPAFFLRRPVHPRLRASSMFLAALRSARLGRLPTPAGVLLGAVDVVLSHDTPLLGRRCSAGASACSGRAL